MWTGYIILYYIIILLICLKVIYDTDSTDKALSYIILVVLFPVVGAVIYFSFGVNYRKQTLYKKKLDTGIYTHENLYDLVKQHSKSVVEENKDRLKHFSKLASLGSMEASLATLKNEVTLMANGEVKFPDLFESMRAAKHHIHVEYYIFENDVIGNDFIDLLIEKANEGVEVRLIYDDFGSQGFKRAFVKKLEKAKVKSAPFYKIKLIYFASSINYRNHRKIVVVDGRIGYVGGINVGDEYINQEKNELYWRDTHLKIHGPAVYNLQQVFLADWNFCAGDDLGINNQFFPEFTEDNCGDDIVQIVASGPDSVHASIMFTIIQAISLAKSEVLITTPYFIPDKALIIAMKIAALSEVDIKLIVPGISDSIPVNAASNSYLQELLEAGVEIYKYNKGFIHAKTLVCDSMVSIVGTANLDQRSFDLNFEINGIVYSDRIAQQLREDFMNDLKDCTQLELESWESRPIAVKMFERVLRLFSPLM